MPIVTVEQKLSFLGEHFRGLWRSREIQPDGTFVEGWSVTFALNNQMTETRYQETPVDALDYAIGVLLKEGVLD